MSTQTQTQTDFYLPANEMPEHREKFSPSGRFRLDIHNYKTKDGCWNYSRGRVYRVSDGNLIADIKRNYSTFHHAFVVKDGTEYLIGGRSYMNQTIVNCDAGCEVEVSDKDRMKMGVAFCWARPMLSLDGNTLVVDGCYWASPYEFKFFDFTNPDRGWPELPILTRSEYDKHKDDLEKADHTCLYSDDKEPEFNEDGTVTVYETTEIYLPTKQREPDITMEELKEYGEAYDNEDNWGHDVEVRHTVRREGNALVIEDTWKSEWQQEQERQRAEWNAKDKTQKEAWMKESELWPELARYLQDDQDLALGDLWWHGSSQNDRDEGDKNHWYFYPAVKAKSEDADRSSHLKWGTIDGPIQAELWVRGKGSHYESFDRSIDGLHKAVETIRGHLR